MSKPDTEIDELLALEKDCYDFLYPIYASGIVSREVAAEQMAKFITNHYARQEAEIRLDELTDVLYAHTRTYKQTVTDSAGNVYVDDSHGYISRYEVQERIAELKAQLTPQAEQERTDV